MRPLSREVLAREAAARVAVVDMPAQSNCAGQGAVWSNLEARHRRSRTEAAARGVVDEIRAKFCSGCPARLGCAQWAGVQKYTGLAAGAAYEAGERKDPGWKVHTRRRSAAS